MRDYIGTILGTIMIFGGYFLIIIDANFRPMMARLRLESKVAEEQLAQTIERTRRIEQETAVIQKQIEEIKKTPVVTEFKGE